MTRLYELWLLACCLLHCVLVFSCQTAAININSSTLVDEESFSAEKLLIRRLRHRYDAVGREGRPVLNVSTVVPVQFGLGLIQMDLDERNKILSMSMWSRYMWTDEYLRWDPAMYDGVSTIRLRIDSIWTPDVMLYNTADVDVELRDALAVVTYDGRVSWFPHAIFRSSCSIDVTNYPFDRQQCHIAFGSWTHSSSEIDLTMAMPGGIDLSTFHAEHRDATCWEITNITGRRGLLPSENDNPNYAVLMFDIFLERKITFSTYILTLPCVFLIILTLVVFWLPPERPDRTALAMNAFGSFMVLLLILLEAAMPTSSTIPLIGIYYCFNMVIIMLSIILSSLVVNVAKGKSNRPPPKWIYLMTTHCIGRIFCLDMPNTSLIQDKKYVPHSSNNHNGVDKNDQRDSLLMQPEAAEQLRLDGEESAGMNNHVVTGGYIKNHNNHHNQQSDSNLLQTSLDCQLQAINTAVQRIELRMHQQHRRETQVQEMLRKWKEVATALDRIFFCIYLMMLIVSLLVLFPKPYHLIDFLK